MALHLNRHPRGGNKQRLPSNKGEKGRVGRIKGKKKKKKGRRVVEVGWGGGRNADSAKTLATDKDGGGIAAERQTRQKQCTL